MTRAGSMIAQEWRQFGIDASTVVAQGTMNDRRGAGDFEAMIAWSVETWGGHPDLSYFLDSWHSNFIAKPGQTQPPRNWQRWSNPDLDKIIEQIRTIGFDDPKGVALGLDYIKLVVREMPTIRLMSYNVFTVMDETYWTVADEPASMVDASLRMSIVALFRTLRDALGVSTIYITHDLATAYTISDRIIIMRHGSVVEAGDARIVLDAPQHPYSMLLKSAILSPDAAGDPDRLRIVPLPETIANTGGRKY
jgi:ABC-type antimicrobial peptide transport system ATPase subunit